MGERIPEPVQFGKRNKMESFASGTMMKQEKLFAFDLCATI
jgi:hypothetical protein